MKNIIYLTIYLVSIAWCINPSNSGKIPKSVIENFSNQNIGDIYGNPGWIKRISNARNSQNRDIQMNFNIPVLLGKYSDVSNTYFSATDFDDLLFDDNVNGTISNVVTFMSSLALFPPSLALSLTTNEKFISLATDGTTSHVLEVLPPTTVGNAGIYLLGELIDELDLKAGPEVLDEEGGIVAISVSVCSQL